jgi:prepilin-type N-terminal cleavage/methylation domain-containing protein/prepilin-type processing-associated H-X9-DG protein
MKTQKTLFENVSGGRGALTLLELLVVIAIIGILAGLIIPAVSKAKNQAARIQCVNNLRQLQLGFSLYHEDFQENFPAAGSRDYYGPHPEDWLWWHQGRDIERSTIASYVGTSLQKELLICSVDKDAAFSARNPEKPRKRPYPFSYALTSYNLRDGKNPGMATIITKEREVHPFRASSIRVPSGKIMLVEEDAATIDDSRWVPEGSKTNLITSRHGGKGVCAFADGHIETVKPEFGLDPRHSWPMAR